MPQAILDAYESLSGISVEYVTYTDQEEALARMQAGEQVDVVVLGDTYLAAAIDAGLLAELDYQNIPNFRNLGANFRDLAYDPENRYSIMIQWGTTGIVARSDRLGAPVTSWADLWDPQYAGKIGVWPYSPELIGITLKSLGYSLNTENPTELAAAEAKLLALRSNVYLLDPNAPTGVANLLDERTAMIYGWSFDIREAKAQLDSVVYVLPQEGTILWSDSVAVPASSTRKRAAEAFIDFLLRPQISAQMVNELWICSPNEAARPYIAPEILENPVVYPPDASLQGAEFYAVLSPATEARHAAMWQRFLAAQGPTAAGAP
jgi:spermidine/putrescine transport system substrate-binding protein